MGLTACHIGKHVAKKIFPAIPDPLKESTNWLESAKNRKEGSMQKTFRIARVRCFRYKHFYSSIRFMLDNIVPYQVGICGWYDPAGSFTWYDRPSTRQFKEKLPWFLAALPSSDCAKGGHGAYTDAIGSTLAAHLDKPRVYIGCMKSGEVFSEP